MFNEEKSQHPCGAAPDIDHKLIESGSRPETPDCTQQFDADWYVLEYPDVALSGLPPYEHYLRFGRFLKRRPCRDGLKSESVPQRPVTPPVQIFPTPSDMPLIRPKRSAGLLRGGFNLPGKDVPIIRGWLARIGENQPRTALVQIGSEHCLKTVSDGFRTDLLENRINEGKHGFELVLPIDLIDGRSHSLRLIDEETGQIIAEETAHWVQERCFSDFSGFLENSFVSPLIYAPFREEDKRCFAVMENIADYLSEKGAALKPGPLVSVIMPVHNRLATVQESIDSVLGQTYGNIELVLIDDGSMDGTLNLLEEIEETDKRIVLLHHPDCRGVSVARNRGLAQAKGDLICYLDSDNTWDCRYVAAMVGAFRHLPDAQAVYSGQMLYRGSQRYPFALRFGSLNRGLLENRNYIDLNAFAHTRHALELSGPFDEKLARFVDWDFILRMTELVRMYSVPVVLSNYCFDKAANTLTNASHLLGQLEKARDKMRARSAATEMRAELAGEKNSRKAARGKKRNVSIIIPSYEALPDLMECIESIRGLRTALNVQLIVVDNASGDPVHRYLDGLAEGKYIRYLRNPLNYGFTHAVNQGLQMAGRNDDVLLLNNDATLARDALDALHDAAYRLPECGLTVPRQVLSGGTKTIIDHVPYACPENDCDVNLSKHHSNLVNTPVFHDGEYTELSFAPFFCVYIKRDVLERAPQLDEKHGRHYRSDRIFCDYVRNILGFRMYHVSEAIAYHKLQRSTDFLQEASLKGGSDFKEICINNAWNEELSRQFGYQAPVWERTASNSYPIETSGPERSGRKPCTNL